MKKIAILSRAEHDSAVFRALYPEVFSEFDKIVIFQDLQAKEKITFPVSRVLHRHVRLLEETDGFDYVLTTSFCGAPYYLMRSFPGKIDVFAFDMLGQKVPSGKVFNEFEATQLELEEDLANIYRDKFVFKNENQRAYLDHYFTTPKVASAIGPDARFPKELAENPFIYLTTPKRACFLGHPVSEAEYVEWAVNGILPPILASFDLTKHILVDQGTDFLDLGKRLLASGEIGGAMLAIDQKRAAAPVFDGQFLGYNDRAWTQQIAETLTEAGMGRYPGFGDPAKWIQSFGKKSRKKPAVSVVIVHFNRPEFLRETIAGFAGQIEKNIEIIIVDNNSTSKPNLTGFEDLNISVVWNMNSYPGYARNLGAEIARGRHILFFDDDNIPKPDLVSRMLERSKNSKDDIVSCFRETFINKINDTGETILSAPSLMESSLLRNYLGDVVFMILRDKFFELRFSDYFRVGREDFEVMYAALKQGFTVGVVPYALYCYRLGNVDKIGNHHLTHRTGAQKGLDFGSFRKYRRALGSYAGAKIFQIVENYHVESRVPVKKDQMEDALTINTWNKGGQKRPTASRPEDKARVPVFDERMAMKNGQLEKGSGLGRGLRHVKRSFRKNGAARWLFYKLKTV